MHKQVQASLKGIEDYFPTEGFTKQEVLQTIRDSFTVFNDEIEKLLQANEHELSDIDPDIGHLYHVVEHTGYHLGQIVDRTKLVTQTSFQFCQNGVNEKALKQIVATKLS